MDTEIAAALISRPLESRDFNEIACWLRTLDGTQRIEFLIRNSNRRAIWRLANSSINSRAEAIDFLVNKLNKIETANSAKTRQCVEFGVTKIGARRTIAEIRSRIPSQPHIVDMAIYHLKNLLKDDDSGREEFDKLIQVARVRPVESAATTAGRRRYCRGLRALGVNVSDRLHFAT